MLRFSGMKPVEEENLETVPEKNIYTSKYCSTF